MLRQVQSNFDQRFHEQEVDEILRRTLNTGFHEDDGRGGLVGPRHASVTGHTDHEVGPAEPVQ